MISRDSGLPLDTRKPMRISGNVFESLLAREGPSSPLENTWHLASFSCGLGPGVIRDPQCSQRQTPRFNQGMGTLKLVYHIGGTYSKNGVVDYRILPISELHLGKLPDSWEFER